MCLDSVYNIGAFLILFTYIYAYLNMRSLDLITQCLTYIVKQSGSSCQICVNTKFRCHHSRKVCYLYGVVKNVLSVRRSEPKSAKQLDKLVVEPVNVGFKHCTLTLLLDLILNLSSCFIYHFLNSCRVYPTVLNEFFKSYSCYLSSYLVKA